MDLVEGTCDRCGVIIVELRKTLEELKRLREENQRLCLVRDERVKELETELDKTQRKYKRVLQLATEPTVVHPGMERIQTLREVSVRASESNCSCREIQSADPRRHFKGCALREPLPEEATQHREAEAVAREASIQASALTLVAEAAEACAPQFGLVGLHGPKEGMLEFAKQLRVSAALLRKVTP